MRALLSLLSDFLLEVCAGFRLQDAERVVLALRFALGLALLSKPMAITLPFVLLLLDYYPLYRLNNMSVGSIIKEKVPFLFLAGGATVINMAAQWGDSVPLWSVPPQMRLMNAFHSIVFYIQKSIIPTALLPMYQMNRDLDYLGSKFVFSALLVVLITGLCVWRALRKERLWATIWFYYLIGLAPTLGFFMSFRHAAANRYTYLPALSLWLLSGLGFACVWAMAGRSRRPFQARVALMFLASVMVSSAFVYQTQQQITVWKNSETFWSVHNRARRIHSRYRLLRNGKGSGG